MAKVVVLIMSADEKFDMAIRLAAGAVRAKRYEDLKVIFFGPSQKRLTKLEGDTRDLFQELLKSGAVDSACIGIAERDNIKLDLSNLGLRLAPAGERISHYVNQGYQVISF